MMPLCADAEGSFVGAVVSCVARIHVHPVTGRAGVLDMQPAWIPASLHDPAVHLRAGRAPRTTARLWGHRRGFVEADSGAVLVLPWNLGTRTALGISDARAWYTSLGRPRRPWDV